MRGDIDHAHRKQSRSPPTIPALHASSATPDQSLTGESEGYQQGEGGLHSWAKKRGSRMSPNVPEGSWMPQQPLPAYFSSIPQLPTHPHLSSPHIQPLGPSECMGFKIL